jgi:hypothetical protein
MSGIASICLHAGCRSEGTCKARRPGVSSRQIGCEASVSGKRSRRTTDPRCRSSLSAGSNRSWWSCNSDRRQIRASPTDHSRCCCHSPPFRRLWMQVCDDSLFHHASPRHLTGCVGSGSKSGQFCSIRAAASWMVWKRRGGEVARDRSVPVLCIESAVSGADGRGISKTLSDRRAGRVHRTAAAYSPSVRRCFRTTLEG